MAEKKMSKFGGLGKMNVKQIKEVQNRAANNAIVLSTPKLDAYSYGPSQASQPADPYDGFEF